MARTTVAYWQHVGTGEVCAVWVDADGQIVTGAYAARRQHTGCASGRTWTNRWHRLLAPLFF